MFIGIGVIYLVALIAEWALWKRVLDNPVLGKVLSAATGYIVAVVIIGFTSAPRGSWNPMAFAYCMVGGVIVGVFFYMRGVKIRNDSFDYTAQPELEETFR